MLFSGYFLFFFSFFPAFYASAFTFPSMPDFCPFRQEQSLFCQRSGPSNFNCASLEDCILIDDLFQSAGIASVHPPDMSISVNLSS